MTNHLKYNNYLSPSDKKYIKSAIMVQPIDKRILVDALQMKIKSVDEKKWVNDHLSIEDYTFINKVKSLIHKIETE